MSEQLTAEQVRDLLHEVAGMLGIRVRESRTPSPFHDAELTSQRDIDAINEGRVVDAMRARGFDVLIETSGSDRWCVSFCELESSGNVQIGSASTEYADMRLVAVLLAAREALKAEEAR